MAHLYRTMAIAALLLPVILHAQERITAQPVSPQTVPSLTNIFKKYALFELNTQALDQFVKKAAAQGEINLELDLPGYMSFPISMHQHDIMSTDYKLVVGTPQGRQEFPRPDCMTYAGVLTGQGNSDVRLTITENIIYGILSGNNKSYFIEPVRYINNQAKENLYVVYETTDVVINKDLGCGVSEIMTRVSTLNLSNARVEGSATGTCKLIELAIASDDSMFIRYRSVAEVQTHNIAAANIMAYFYGNTQLGPYYVDFTIKGQYVSTAAANNALVTLTITQDASILLGNFGAWGNAGNFGFTYDIGVYWTTKNIYTTGTNSNNYMVIGLATINGACGVNKYQILEDFSINGLVQALVEAHETGHNLGANHDGYNDLFIMAPSISVNNTTFSAASISSFTTFVTNATCFSACTNTLPIAQYAASVPHICAGNNITFTNYSVGQISGISWTFQDGTPATSTAQAPVVTFSTPGLKTVTLTATNANGSNSITKSIFVGASLTGAGCRSVTTGNGEYVSLSILKLANINNNSGGSYINGRYTSYTCSNMTVLYPATNYYVEFTVGYLASPWDISSWFQLFIDYNADGDFSDANEIVYTSPSCLQGTFGFIYTTPATVPVTDAFLRMRAVARSCGTAATDGCSLPNNSYVDDYAVYFASSTSLPLLLTSFDGYYSNGKNELNWKTETEVNTDHFVVERSFNGTDYVEVGNVPAKGLTGNLINYYQFTDGLINADNFSRFYYRLKMVDKDGAYKYSKLVITTRPDEGNVQVLVYPNPVSRNTTLQIKKADNNMSVIEVFNSMGQRVYTKRMMANLYNTSIDIPGNWSPGIYMIRVSDSKASWSRSVMVK